MGPVRLGPTPQLAATIVRDKHTKQNLTLSQARARGLIPQNTGLMSIRPTRSKRRSAAAGSSDPPVPMTDLEEEETPVMVNSHEFSNSENEEVPVFVNLATVSDFEGA